MKRYALICETAFQLLNTVFYVLDMKEREIAEFDLYLDLRKPRMEEVLENLKRENIFNSIHTFLSPVRSEGKYRYQAKRFVEYLFPRFAIRTALQDEVHLKKKAYDVIVMGCPNPFMVNFAYLFPQAKVYFIDEGTGSYNGKIGQTIRTKTVAFFENLTHRGPGLICPEKLILHKPQICKSEYEAEVEQLYAACEGKPQKMQCIQRVFGNDSQKMYQSAKWIYFGQPTPKAYPGDFEQVEPKIRETILKVVANVLVRPHPAEERDKYGETVCDWRGLQWEVICADQIFDDSVLIGTFSTAQFTPKLIYNKEPYVVMTLRVFNDFCSPEAMRNIESLIESFSTLYEDHTKIYMPESIEELEACMQEIRSRVLSDV